MRQFVCNIIGVLYLKRSLTNAFIIVLMTISQTVDPQKKKKKPVVRPPSNLQATPQELQLTRIIYNKT